MANVTKVGNVTFTEYPVGGGKRRVRIQNAGLQSITLDLTDEQRAELGALITGKSSTGKAAKGDSKPDAKADKSETQAPANPELPTQNPDANPSEKTTADGKAEAPKGNSKGEPKSKGAK